MAYPLGSGSVTASCVHDALRTSLPGARATTSWPRAASTSTALTPSMWRGSSRRARTMPSIASAIVSGVPRRDRICASRIDALASFTRASAFFPLAR